MTMAQTRRQEHDRQRGRMKPRMLRVTAPHFVAALVLDATGHCVETAPILAASIGKSEADLMAYFKRRGWRVEVW